MSILTDQPLNRHSRRTLAVIGNYLPRQCGIATFTTDLLNGLAQEATEADCYAVVMNDRPEGYRYPEQVRFELDQMKLSDYPLAADFLNMNNVDVVCLQHEYGIFGGDNGAYILKLIEHLRMPVVTTLHTVLQDPSFGQRNVMCQIAAASDKLIVMAHKAKELLVSVYGIAAEKVEVIPHGIPDVPFVDPNYYKDQFGVVGRKVLLTFGLLSPNKGIEYVIDALPAIVKEHPDVTYMVLGQTHPKIKETEGEAYRLSLQRRVRRLGVDEHVVFHDRFVDLSILCEFLGAADLYVTPYLNRDQITSGTLAIALGAGKATVSTGYWYAEELLADDRGRLVPFADAQALACEISDLLSKDVERHAIRRRAYDFGRRMVWKEVSRRYLAVFDEVLQERRRQPQTVFAMRSMKNSAMDVPELKLDHLYRLTDDVGILQHANFITPNRFHGYCTDDNARALITALMAHTFLPERSSLLDLSCRYLSFLHYAFNDETGRFRNFMGYDRTWLETQGSEDSHGRALWALGTVVGLSESDDLRGTAIQLFERALPALMDCQSPRAWAFGLVGIDAYLKQYNGDSEVRRIGETLAQRLFEKHRRNATADWSWFEDVLTYANAKVPQALILAGAFWNHPDMLQAGIDTLCWLVEIQTDDQDRFAPVGSTGWYPRARTKARYAQQPIEAMNTIEACYTAYRITRDEKWIAVGQRCLEWFLGRNDLSLTLYDYRTGGCCDGLEAKGVNHNQGAESTVAWLLSLTHLYCLRSQQTSAVQENLVNV